MSKPPMPDPLHVEDYAWAARAIAGMARENQELKKYLRWALSRTRIENTNQDEWEKAWALASKL